MSWVGAVPAVATAALALLLPGLLLGWCLRLRGTLLAGLAAPLSVTVVSVTGVLAQLVGVPFGAVPVLLSTVVAGLVGACVVVLLDRSPSPSAARPVARASARSAALRAARRAVATRAPDRPRVLAAGLAGCVVAAGCGTLAVRRGIPDPASFPQTYDAVFHLSAVWHVVRTGDGSALTLGVVASPGRTHAFYPAAWHDVAALVVQLSGAPVTVAASAVSLAVVAIVWPLSSLLLARAAFGPRPAVLFAAAAVSTGFSAAPYLLLSYGTLWPNALGTALLPAVLGVAVSLARRDGVAWPSALAVAVAVLPGLALAHPNVVVSALLLVTALVATEAGRWAGARHPRRRRRVTTVVTAGLVVGLVELWLVARSPLFATTRGTSWPSRQTVAQAAGEWFAAAPMRAPVPWVLAVLVLVGLGVAARTPRHHWLAVTHLVAGAAYVLVAGSDGPVARALSGPWYDDPFRLAALLGVTAVPLAALGSWRLAVVVAGASRAWRCPAFVASLRRPGPAVATLTLLVLLVGGGGYAGANARVLATWYAGGALAGAPEQALLRSLGRIVPPGESVAGSPWTGASLSGPLGGRDAVFPHLSGGWGSDRELVAARLDEAATDPGVCAAVRRLHVGYVLDGPSTFWPDDPRQDAYPGLRVAGAPGFEPVATGGRLTLYRVTACDPVTAAPTLAAQAGRRASG
ncbi:DUF6541 family protein [Phycicoccus sp. 3266]|uniref:DUF6541 family protein n=1 Tax=Phycicoccus sp. 3266 TaxID=2817751 RepID=UPI002857BA55|nr:DUF6541 family protein [Phycicoccus sp. 3266]MDR6861626.1 hypothetical protein [Phycicoccus sp. 3266]